MVMGVGRRNSYCRESSREIPPRLIEWERARHVWKKAGPMSWGRISPAVVARAKGTRGEPYTMMFEGQHVSHNV